MTEVTDSAELLVMGITGAAHFIPGIPRLLKLVLIGACVITFVALQFLPLRLPIDARAASWLGWFSLAMLAPLFWVALGKKFDRKWTVPDREPEGD